MNSTTRWIITYSSLFLTLFFVMIGVFVGIIDYVESNACDCNNDLFHEVLTNFSRDHEYDTELFDCKHYAVGLYDELAKHNISSRIVGGCNKPESDCHVWVEATVPVSAIFGKVYFGNNEEYPYLRNVDWHTKNLEWNKTKEWK